MPQPPPKCLTCQNPVSREDPQVSSIIMNYQLRYYHVDGYACQKAENSRKNHRADNDETWTGLQTREKFSDERKQMAILE